MSEETNGKTMQTMTEVVDNMESGHKLFISFPYIECALSGAHYAEVSSDYSVTIHYTDGKTETRQGARDWLSCFEEDSPPSAFAVCSFVQAARI